MTVPTRPLPVTDEHLKAIGTIVVECSVMELFLQLALCMLLGMNEAERRAIVTRMNTGQVVDYLKELAPMRLSGADAKSFLAILEPFPRLLQGRHDIIHGIWITSDKGEVALGTFRGKTRVGGRGTRKSVEDLETLTNQIRQANYSLQEFLLPRGGFREIGVSLQNRRGPPDQPQ